MRETQKKFFHTIDKHGQIMRQGIVLRQSQNRVTVEFFSWLTGFPNGQQTFNNDETTTWRFYESESAWRRVGDKLVEQW